MAEVESEPGHDSGAKPSPRHVAQSPAAGVATAPGPKEPGWYPVRTNPNEQAYWDGSDWARRRLWNAGSGWTETGAGAGPAPAGTLAVSGQRMSANPYAPHPTTTAPSVRPAPGVTIGLFIVVASSIAVMVGSVTTWITSSASFTGGSRFGGFAFSSSTTVSGVDQGMSTLIGINGYMTLVAGTVVLVFAGLMAASDATSIRLVGSVAALASLGLSIYAVVRLVEKLDAAHTPHGVSLDVGWGVILVLGASAVATMFALYELTRSR